MSKTGRGGAIAGIVVAGVLLAGCLTSSSTAPPHPRGEVASLTGYAGTSPTDEAGVATTVRISAATARTIERAIASLTPTRPVTCWENELLFSLRIIPHAGSPGGRAVPSYSATAVLCPVPGVVTVTVPGGVRSYVATCRLVSLAASYLPAGRSAACFRRAT